MIYSNPVLDVAHRLYCLAVRPYLEWRWQHGRKVVCGEPWCLRMCSPEWVWHCDKHGPMYE